MKSLFVQGQKVQSEKKINEQATKQRKLENYSKRDQREERS